jgi:hypothetical protein
MSMRNGSVAEIFERWVTRRQSLHTQRAYYVDLATKRPVSWFATEFLRWPYEPYAPIRQQTFIILNQVNRARKAAGLDLIPTSCVRLKRRIYRPFDEPFAVGAESAGGCLVEKGSALEHVMGL